MTSRLLALSIILASFSSPLFSQIQWHETDASSFEPVGKRVIQAKEYRLVEVDFGQLTSYLAAAPMEGSSEAVKAALTLEVPMPDGRDMTFEVVESPVVASEFTSRFPDIRTYAGTVADRPGVYGRFDVTPQGFHAMVMRAGESTVFIDPFTHGGGDVAHYMSYERQDFLTDKVFDCGVQSDHRTFNDFSSPAMRLPFAECERKEYRLAITATGEYTGYHGGVTGAAAAMVTTMNRVNGVYGRDLGIRMIIIGNNADIIYPDANTDPFNGTNAGAMIDQNQTNTNAVIGSSNYDIGHIFSTGGSGLASLNSVCSGSKARGVTGIFNPVGDPFDIDYVSHEIGHQFGGTHTQNNSCNRTNYTAVEPGSASTIMGYAGICSPNVQSNSDDHFHGANLFQMGNFIEGFGGSCAQAITIDNSPPTIGSHSTGHTIPRSTPFVLDAEVVDVDGDLLTYCWEQMDTEVASMPPSSNATGGPAFRSNSPSTSSRRYFPPLSDVVDGNGPTWEVLSEVDRSYDFRLSVRDNTADGSCTEYADAYIDVEGDSGPFLTLSPSAAGVIWNTGSAQTILWDVAGTDSGPVNCNSVDIKLSIDGGLTYPIILSSATTNDGSENIIVPNVVTSTARVMVEAADNIFYDISDNDFLIESQLEAPCVNGFAGAYPCQGYDLVDLVDMTDLGFPNGVQANDIWGWTDPLDGKEYALLGLTNGTSFIDISTPSSPIVLGHLPTHTSNSTWRDVKVYQDHAFVVSEANGHGMQVFDLTRLRDVASPPVTFTEDAHFPGFGDAHNIVIDEASGYAYAVGTDFFSGGLQIIDIQDPTSPTAAGGFSEDGYTHDAQVVVYNGPDTDHQGKQIAFCSNEDTFTIVDVNDKTDPQQISRNEYDDSGYAHQGWLTEDHRYFLMNDEFDEQQNSINTRTYIWDAADLDAPVLLGFYDNPNSTSIDHNLYTLGDRVYEANYRSGLRVLDISDIANAELEEVGFFDVYPANDAPSFNGAWSNYPYFASGNIIVSSIEEGLFIVAPTPDGPCVPPTSVQISSLSSGSVTLSWTGSPSADSFDVEVVASGAAPSGIPTASGITVTEYSFDPPESGTSYDFYVRSNCGANDFSSFMGPLTVGVPDDFCSVGQYVDEGGVNGDYGNGLDEVTVICPDSPGQIQVNFLTFDVEDRSDNRCYDELFIFDGPDVGSSPITPLDLGFGTTTTDGFCYSPSASNGSGDLAGRSIVSTHASGCLTFRFVSDGSVVEEGWVAEVVCPGSTVCPGDLNGDQVVNIADFVLFNSAFGTSCADCLEDMDGDGVVGVSDFTAFNSAFGQSCSPAIDTDEETIIIQSTLNNELRDALQGMTVHPELEKVMRRMSSAALAIYPNPGSGEQMTVVFDGTRTGWSMLTIRDLMGKVIWRQEIRASDVGQVVIDFHQPLSGGTYLLTERSEGGVLTERFVVD